MQNEFASTNVGHNIASEVIPAKFSKERRKGRK